MSAGRVERDSLRLLQLLLSGMLVAGPVAADAFAQAPPSPPGQQAGESGQAVPDTDYAPPAPGTPAAISATRFVMPDLPDDWKAYTAYAGRLFSTAFSLVALVDYNAFVQDSDSRTQVGDQGDEWDLRTLRLMFRGQLKFSHPIDYLISMEVKG